MIAVIDYGVGNLRSVVNALRHLDADVSLVADPSDLAGTDKIILPGVGAFGAGMEQLRSAGFEGALHRAVERGVPLLGICLGMQFMFEASEEMGEYRGLGLLPGHVVRFSEDGPKVPHIGWNQLNKTRDSALLRGVSDGAYAYFVHSYYADPDDPNDVLASTDYGLDFASVVGRGNVFGVQFHPEKSQAVGLRILRNFVEMRT
jgi:glutamine amidotransferase